MEFKILTKTEIDNCIKNRMVELIKSKPNCVLGLATGSSPIGLYKLLVDEYKNKNISFKNIISFNLDEYYPIDFDNSQSYHSFMNQHLFSKIDIQSKNTHFPSLNNNYDQMIDECGGIDFQILGIGSNGHIGFNEPGTEFDSLTHVVDLKESTIKDNSRFFNSIKDVPTKAITSGLQTIMKAKEIVVIVVGSNKKEAVKILLSKKITKDCPATILHKHHNVTIYIDKDTVNDVKL